MLLVYALTHASQHGWATTETVGLLAASAALIVGFLVIEMRSPAPLLPLRIFRLRTLTASNITALLMGAAVFSQFFLLTLYMQQVLHYSALKTESPTSRSRSRSSASRCLAGARHPRGHPPRAAGGHGPLGGRPRPVRQLPVHGTTSRPVPGLHPRCLVRCPARAPAVYRSDRERSSIAAASFLASVSVRGLARVSRRALQARPRPSGRWCGRPTALAGGGELTRWRRRSVTSRRRSISCFSSSASRMPTSMLRSSWSASAMVA